jgi:filamentous hemagglutinin family protein
MLLKFNIFLRWITITLIAAFWVNSANAQITPDASLGSEASKITPNVDIKGLPADRIDGGATRGANLFHSFSEFNIRDSQRVYFSNPTGIENILMRVTGGKVSNILGTLGVTGNANLFLMNPNGIVFGNNARLDLGGSFVASTANSFVFGDGLEFSATSPETPSELLRINPVALFFNQINPERIENLSTASAGINFANIPITGLRVPDGQSLLLAGGEILLNGGGLHASGGRVELSAVLGLATVGLSVDGKNWSLSIAESVELADISLENQAFVSTSDKGGGDIRIWGRKVNLTGGSRIQAITLGEGNGGNLIVNASELLHVKGIEPNGRFASGLFAPSFGKGSAGNLVINTEKLVVEKGAQIGTGSFREASGGSLTVNASKSVQVIGTSDDGRVSSGLFTQNETKDTTKAGDLTIITGQLLVQGGGQISTANLGKGAAGNLTVQAAESVKLIGTTADGVIPSGLFSVNRSSGNSGDLTIITGQLLVRDGAQISSSANTGGRAGNLIINASDSVKVIGGSSDSLLSVLYSITLGEQEAGALTINTSKLQLQNGAQVGSGTFGKGDGANLTVNASEFVELIGKSADGQFPTALFTATRGSGSAGKANITTNKLIIRDGAGISSETSDGKSNDITINANSLAATNGGQLRTTTSGENNAGNIILKVIEDITLTGKDTGIFANTTPESQGNGGNIFIDPRRVTIQDGAKIAVDSQGTGIGGDVELFAGLLTLNNGQISAETRSNTGGNINLNLQDLLLLRNGSQITTTAGNKQFGGDGGNISINTPFIVAVPNENSDITANAFSGTGGKVNITTNGIFGIQSQPRLTQFSDITASSELGVDGEVSLNTPEVDPARGLEELPESVVDVAGLINQNLCTAARQGSEFVVTGRGGLPVTPYDILQGGATWEDWYIGEEQGLSTAKPGRGNNQLQQKNQESQQIAEAQGWIIANNGNVILTAKPAKVTPQGTWLHPLDCRMLREG